MNVEYRDNRATISKNCSAPKSHTMAILKMIKSPIANYPLPFLCITALRGEERERSHGLRLSVDLLAPSQVARTISLFHSSPGGAPYTQFTGVWFSRAKSKKLG